MAQAEIVSLRDSQIEKLQTENQMLREQVSRQGDIMLNAAKNDGGRLMPAQMSQLLTMQRERIDFLEANYSTLYKRYETQIEANAAMRK